MVFACLNAFKDHQRGIMSIFSREETGGLGDLLLKS